MSGSNSSVKNYTYCYTGSYTTDTADKKRGAAGEGIHVFRIKHDTEEWEPIQTVPEHDPSFIGFGRDGSVLYAAQSASPADLAGIVSYHVDRESGRLEKMPVQMRQHKAICCFDIHSSQRYLVEADFKGNLEVIRLRGDGSLEERTDLVALEGTLGPLTKIQKTSRPHHILFEPGGDNLIVPDKGLDAVHVFRLNPESGKLTHLSSTPVRPASCARHIAYHTNREFVYVVAEYTCKIHVFRYSSENGILEPIQIISSERNTFCGINCKNAEVQVHPSGRFLYVSNRGDNTIGIFGIDAHNGTLSPLGWEETRGDSPRFFCLDPAGKNMYVGNQKSGNISIFSIDEKSGMPTYSGRRIAVDCPTWLLFSR